MSKRKKCYVTFKEERRNVKKEEGNELKIFDNKQNRSYFGRGVAKK